MKKFIAKINLSVLLFSSFSLYSMDVIHYVSDTCKETLADTSFWGAAALASADRNMDFHNSQLKTILGIGALCTVIKNGIYGKNTTKNSFADVTINTALYCGTTLAWLGFELKNGSNLLSLPFLGISTYVGCTYLSNLHKAGLLKSSKSK